MAAHPIDATHMVTVDLGFADTLGLLAQRELLFVIEGGEVWGLITFSDLQRIPVGMALLSMILATEPGLSALIRRLYGEEGWLGFLSKEQRGEVRKRYGALATPNLEVSLLDPLQLGDCLRLVGCISEYRSLLGFDEEPDFQSWAAHLKRTRRRSPTEAPFSTATPMPPERSGSCARSVASRRASGRSPKGPRRGVLRAVGWALTASEESVRQVY